MKEHPQPIEVEAIPDQEGADLLRDLANTFEARSGPPVGIKFRRVSFDNLPTATRLLRWIEKAIERYYGPSVIVERLRRAAAQLPTHEWRGAIKRINLRLRSAGMLVTGDSASGDWYLVVEITDGLE